MSPLRLPWRSPRALFRHAGYNLTALPVAAVVFAVTIALLSVTFGLLVTFVFAVPFAWLLFVVSRGFAAVERSRAAALMDTQIADPVPPFQPGGWFSRLWQRVRSGPRWKEIAHHVANLPVAAVGFALTVAAWGGSVAMLTMPFVVDDLPGGTAKFWFFELHPGAGAWLAAAAGVVGIVAVAPWLTVAIARGELRMARALLGPTAAQAHAAEVSRLETRSRAAVDSAETERRRIERDLHDGAQQRLVALAANLGAAREKLDHDETQEGRQMVAVAHEEAKAALKDLRDLVRGIHPVILEDRGLDAALSAVVARSPIPVELTVDLVERPPATVESAAYFVVSEALANVARHAGATRAKVGIVRARDRLIVEVRDDGVGGADPSAGTGLAGLADRVAGLGGTMDVLSPPGGPTTVLVELPCAS